MKNFLSVILFLAASATIVSGRAVNLEESLSPREPIPHAEVSALDARYEEDAETTVEKRTNLMENTGTGTIEARDPQDGAAPTGTPVPKKHKGKKGGKKDKKKKKKPAATPSSTNTPAATAAAAAATSTA